MSDPDSAIAGCERALRQFVHREADLLDERRFEDWLALFAEDGRYWIPSAPGQTDPLSVPSIVYEDPALLRIRVKRLMHPRAHAALPTPRTLHVVGNLEVRDHDAATGRFRVSSSLLVVEHQDAAMRNFVGKCEHVLRRSCEDFQIVLKRIDLIDCDSIHRLMTALL